MTTLIRIKRLLISGRIRFTEKAVMEAERDQLTPEMIVEAILNAPAIAKKVRSQNPVTRQREYLYIISGQTYSGIIIYTKGKILKQNGQELFYILISSKRDVT